MKVLPDRILQHISEYVGSVKIWSMESLRKYNEAFSGLILEAEFMYINNIVQIEESCKNEYNLNSLIVHYSGLTLNKDKEGNQLFNALKLNKKLRKFSLSLPNFTLSETEGTRLADSLIFNKFLTHFQLNHLKNIDSAAMHSLSKALSTNKTLRVLDLSFNKIENIGIKILLNSLEFNLGLEELNLCDNVLNAASCSVLTKVLKNNTTLKTLKLQGTSIGQNSCEDIAKLLEENHNLLNLDLSFNFIGPNGGVALAVALQVNTTLQSLNLEGNMLGLVGGHALANALSINKSLVLLNLQNTGTNSTYFRDMCPHRLNDQTVY